jgi:ABC-2 type transport system ATP-binding protein
VFGHDVVKDADVVRRRISLAGQFASVDEELTGLENLILVARLLGYTWSASKARATELIQAFGLTEAAKRQVKHYSGGMRRRLDIAASVIVSPDLLFLDEPTTGLDPRSRRYIWDVIRALRVAGTTVLLTTQYLEEADELADRIVIMNHGTIIADGTPDQLKTSLGFGMLRIRLHDPTQQSIAQEIMTQILEVPAQPDSDSAVLTAQISEADRVMNVFKALSDADISLAEFALKQPSLDEVFLSLTDQPLNVKNVHNQEIAS